MITFLIILILIGLIVYLYYRLKQEQDKPFFGAVDPNQDLQSKYSDLQSKLSGLQSKHDKVVKVNKTFASFCQNEIGGKDIEEIRTKLNGRKLSEILEELQDYETEVDTLRRSKGELEADLLAQSNSFKSLIKEKEGVIKRLTQEKVQLQEWSNKELGKLKEELKDLRHE